MHSPSPNGFLNRRSHVRIMSGTPPITSENNDLGVAQEAHEARTPLRATVQSFTKDGTAGSGLVRGRPNQLLRYVEVTNTRHGRTVYYFRRNKGPRIRLPDDCASPAFLDAYTAALSGAVPPPKRKPLIRPKNANLQKIELAMEKAVNTARLRSRAKERDFALSLDWALAKIESQGFRCSLTGIPFYADIEDSRYRHPFAPSIDRINSDLGYLESNCRIVVTAINLAMADWGEDVFRKIALGYARTHRFTTSEEHRASRHITEARR